MKALGDENVKAGARGEDQVAQSGTARPPRRRSPRATGRRIDMAKTLHARSKDTSKMFLGTTDTLVPVIGELRPHVRPEVRIPEIALLDFKGLITDEFTQYARAIFNNRGKYGKTNGLTEYMHVFHATKVCIDDGRRQTCGEKWIDRNPKVVKPQLKTLESHIKSILRLPSNTHFEWSILYSIRGPSKSQNWHLDDEEGSRDRQLSLLINIGQSEVTTNVYW
eukprot:CAMPEP_0170186384 /NCGR_PEP_ID=MMETSP0040_2-20121228/38965_1 /TAXON_ID=641309 /ORGANISM="Lotharella oceanica, Strain CCMP622" /LENGTH=221 /DNA_ID=CAMNT_0010433107 /DNA_START=22 /DNA_END=684 /DNA_ORIENTATION=-